MSTKFKIVFLIRFLGYFLFLTGLIVILSVLTPVVQSELGYRKDRLFNVKRTVPKIITSDPKSGSEAKVSFGEISQRENIITPASTQFGVVIEKINANSKIVANVNSLNESEYISALGKGIAHARGTSFPGQGGNIYLFSHSTDAPWNLVRFNAVFYLLRELEPGDKVIVFFQDRRFDYVVYDKRVVEPDDVGFLTDTYDQEVLTLQTCDPPGTLFKRLIVRARLDSSLRSQ